MSNLGMWSIMTGDEYSQKISEVPLKKFSYTFDGCERAEFEDGIVVIKTDDPSMGRTYYCKPILTDSI